MTVFGEALWARAQHAVRTRDSAFARAMLGPVEDTMARFERERASEPWGLMPASIPGDDGLTTGHITGDNFGLLLAESVKPSRWRK
jgi:hypothetical protein